MKLQPNHMRHEPPGKTHKQPFRRLLLLIPVILLAIAGIQFFRTMSLHQSLEKSRRQLQQSAGLSNSQTDQGAPSGINFSNLPEDVAFWLTIPGTKINDPVMQEKVPGRYFYSFRNPYGNWDGKGSFLVPAVPGGNWIEGTKKNTAKQETLVGDTKQETEIYGTDARIDAHTLILGHRMYTPYEERFSHLIKYYGSQKESEKRKDVYLTFPTHTEHWEVIAAGDAPGNDLLYRTPYEVGSGDYQKMLTQMKSRLRYQKQELDKDTRILVLSTCNDTVFRKGRFFVVCRRIE